MGNIQHSRTPMSEGFVAAGPFGRRGWQTLQSSFYSSPYFFWPNHPKEVLQYG
jgi:hypothetical protein